MPDSTNADLVPDDAEESDDSVRLERFLDTRGLKAGDRIPSERDLVALLSISRRRVRRSLARLEAEKRVWRGVGRGTFLGREPPANDARGWPAAGPAHLIQARLALEPAIAATAALSASSRDLAEMENCVRKNLEVDTDPEWGLWDTAFHGAVARATQNPILIDLVLRFGEARADTEWGGLRRALVDADARRRFALEHRRVFEAVRARDAAQASTAMHDHLRSVQNTLFEEKT